MITGLLIGFLLGFIIKRSRICFTGCIRDWYLEKRVMGIYVILLIILSQSVIYFVLVKSSLIIPNTYKPFSLVAIALGSFLFGLGCIFANGCITLSIVKTGDGRIAGLISLLSFAIFATATRQGLLKPSTSTLQGILTIEDKLVPTLPFSIFFLIIPLFILVLWLSYHDNQKHKLKFTPTAKYHGLRHILCEKNWNLYVAGLLMGLVAGFAWYANGQLGITGNVISWLNIIVSGNPITLNWGNNFVLGILLGSFICCFASLEFSLKPVDAKAIILAIIGGILMGVGSVWAQGCMLGNGLIGTATFSLKSWYALLFIAIGIWFGAYVFYVRPSTNKK